MSATSVSYFTPKRFVKVGLRYLLRIIDKNYDLARARFHLMLSLSNLFKKNPPLLIYQMGKVGSTTIMGSLKKKFKETNQKRSIWHVHALSDDRIKYNSQIFRKIYRDNLLDIKKRDPHVWCAEFIRKHLDTGYAGKKWEIITSIRDPVARNISDFFQGLKNVRDYGYPSKLRSMEIDEILNEIIPMFWEKQPHEFPLTWFDTQFFPYFDIDVYATPFPTSKGYAIYESNRARLLLLRLENMYECAPLALKEFLDIDDYHVQDGNVSDKKDYSILYKRFLETVEIPESYLDKMYNSKFIQHFYSDEEIERFRRKWARKL